MNPTFRPFSRRRRFAAGAYKSRAACGTFETVGCINNTVRSYPGWRLLHACLNHKHWSACGLAPRYRSEACP